MGNAPTEQEAEAIAASTDTELLVVLLQRAADGLPDFEEAGPRMQKVAHLAKCMIAGLAAGFQIASGTPSEVVIAQDKA